VKEGVHVKDVLAEEIRLIAPCGMNCSLCIGFLRDKSKCNGCYTRSDYKPGYCKVCVIKNCEQRETIPSGFCYECSKFPCRRLKQLDKRYRNKYHMSMLENLNDIKNHGIEAFINHENSRWKCPDCGARVSVHRSYCLNCHKELQYDD